MRRLTVLTAVLVLLAVVGCGSTTASTPTTPAPETAASRQVKEDQAKIEAIKAKMARGFFDMGTLGKSLKTDVNKKVAKTGNPVRVSSVTCIQTGKQTAQCHLAMSSGSESEALNIGVDISEDGQTYITHPG
jgi:uncharacterized protein YceK